MLKILAACLLRDSAASKTRPLSYGLCIACLKLRQLGLGEFVVNCATFQAQCFCLSCAAPARVGLRGRHTWRKRVMHRLNFLSSI